MYIMDEELKFPKSNFYSMKYQPFYLKPRFSMLRIKEWFDYWDGLVYISFSGGLDSTVLAYIACSAYREYHLDGTLPLVFADTGMEFPEIRGFVPEYFGWLKNEFPEVDICLVVLQPKHGFRWICENHGFPIISKETAQKIRKLRYGNLSERYRNYILNGDERGKLGMLSKKWQYLADKVETPEDISDLCCEVLKREPFKRYVRKTKRRPMVGITQDESFRRERQYSLTGCNQYSGEPKSQPLGFWPKQEVIQFAVDHNIPICKVYGHPVKDADGNWYFTGEQRTGCVLCGFGSHLEKGCNRFQRLACSENPTHRAMYDAGMQFRNHGVTYEQALHHCGISTS